MEMILLVGIQGSGKTTFFRERFFDTHVRVSLDMLRTRERERILIAACLMAQQPLVIDNTNTLASERAGYIDMARNSGFRTVVYFFKTELRAAIARSNSRKEDRMYAAIRQGKAKTGMAEELTRRIKEGAIPIISDVEGFMGYYVVYAPDDTVTAISLFNNFASAEEANRRAIAWIEKDLAPLLTGPATAMAGPVIVHTLA